MSNFWMRESLFFKYVKVQTQLTFKCTLVHKAQTLLARYCCHWGQSTNAVGQIY